MSRSGSGQPLRTAFVMPQQERSVVTLNPPLAAAVRRMGSLMGDGFGGDLGPTETVRRACEVLDFKLNLSDNEEYVVRNKDTGEVTRVRYSWEMLNHHD